MGALWGNLRKTMMNNKSGFNENNNTDVGWPDFSPDLYIWEALEIINKVYRSNR